MVECEHCGGQMTPDKQESEDNWAETLKCLQCNHTKIIGTPLVSKPIRLSKNKRRAILEKNKEAVIADYNNMKTAPFLRKWHLSSYRWKVIKEELGIPPKGRPKSYKRRTKKEISGFKNEHEELVYLRGYRQAILDEGGKR